MLDTCTISSGTVTQVQLHSDSFSHNNGPQGGAISSTGQRKYDHQDNNASGNVRGMYIHSGYGKAQWRDSVMMSNTAGNHGGGCQMTNSDVTLTDVQWINNYAAVQGEKHIQEKRNFVIKSHEKSRTCHSEQTRPVDDLVLDDATSRQASKYTTVQMFQENHSASFNLISHRSNDGQSKDGFHRRCQHVHKVLRNCMYIGEILRLGMRSIIFQCMYNNHSEKTTVIREHFPLLCGFTALTCCVVDKCQTFNLKRTTQEIDGMEEEDEKELEKYILQQFTWDKLPSAVRKRLENSREVWKEKVQVTKYSIKHQLRWKTNIVKQMYPDEKAYYQQILKISRTHFMLYPYHLADVMTKTMRMTPFRFYLEMMEDVMRGGVRLLGIGRNEYIDNMNRCRSRGWLWKMKRNAFKECLPTHPVEIEIEYWWMCVRSSSPEEDLRSMTEMERSVLALLDVGPRQAGTLDRNSVHSLYTKGSIYLDVPIGDDDYISVPPLENFVMNRVSGDYFENLLYKIFVSLDERTSVKELSSILDVDLEMAKQAVSLYCRLAFAKKKTVEPLLVYGEDEMVGIRTQWHSTWLLMAKTQSSSSLFDNESSQTSDSLSSSVQTPKMDSPTIAKQFTAYRTDSSQQLPHKKRIGFIFDYTLTALLMMGNLGSGLKMHAVTMYEVGKLSEESLEEFLQELDKVSDVAEGEAQRYHDHAIALRETIYFLRKKINSDDRFGGVDLLRSERLASLDPNTRERILYQNYEMLISMAPISNESEVITSTTPRHFGPAIAEFNSMWMRLYLYHCAGDGPPCQMLTRGARVRVLPEELRVCSYLRMFSWTHDSIISPISGVLQILNEHLLDCPVMIQYFGESADTMEICVPFPFDAVEGKVPRRETDYNADNLHKHPLLQKLQEKLMLAHSFGYIKMLRIKGIDGQLRWVPEDVYFGIPLNDLVLNQKVTAKIQQYDLFSAENMDKQSEAARTLSIRLLDFITSHVNLPPRHNTHPLHSIIKANEPKVEKTEEIEFDLETVPYPSKNLRFTREDGLTHLTNGSQNRNTNMRVTSFIIFALLALVLLSITVDAVKSDKLKRERPPRPERPDLGDRYDRPERFGPRDRKGPMDDKSKHMAKLLEERKKETRKRAEEARASGDETLAKNLERKLEHLDKQMERLNDDRRPGAPHMPPIPNAEDLIQQKMREREKAREKRIRRDDF
ncbi:hypothetical protein PROFUN_10607 [Planoprotostelium fungivorum]|uniref:Uncharacterized protein n=1 Tax=Planoprotostelium fungivorum TaxID=1890364 RepID=A0A2P6ND72_9EUKA|nr:hypothetical protein PROFUN_10607 [Planoprotostelium fungivorum]